MESPKICLLLLGLNTMAVAVTTTTPGPQCPESDECFRDLNQAQKDLNITHVCAALSKGGNCFSAVEKKCAQSFRKMFDNAIIHLDDDEMKFGCDGACAKAAEKCLSSLSGQINQKTEYNLQICRTMNDAFKCLENLKTTACSKNIKTALLYYSKYTKAEKFSDICDEHGRVSDCYKNFLECSESITAMTDESTVEEVCKRAAVYLQCEGRAQCKGTFKQEKAWIRHNLETEESQYKCPTRGSCNERIIKCTSNSQTAMAHYANGEEHKGEICTELTATGKCFESVRVDPVCLVDAAQVSDIETKFTKLKDQACGASPVVISAALVMAGLFVSTCRRFL